MLITIKGYYNLNLSQWASIANKLGVEDLANMEVANSEDQDTIWISLTREI